jgi:hypothetical protein
MSEAWIRITLLPQRDAYWKKRSMSGRMLTSAPACLDPILLMAVIISGSTARE